jgi:hypothetical protein
MGKISAFDKDTMQELWSFESGTQFAGNPMTYAVNGKQYVGASRRRFVGCEGKCDGKIKVPAFLLQHWKMQQS